MRAQWPLALLAALHDAANCHWIDEDTPSDLRSTVSLIDGSTYELVMSDEFNVPHRSFADGDDPTWTALDKSDDDYSASGGGSLHFYNSSTVTTTPDGMLTIRTVMDPTEWNRYDPLHKEWTREKKHFKSGMLQSWNKFCFSGGIIEVDAILPGEPDIGGLWPAIWLLGNLGRATYEASTNNIWPWSYDVCDRKKQQSQSISACNVNNHFGLNKFQGRGATEIDILEMMGGDSKGPLPATVPPISLPYIDFTLQVAPGIPDNRPQSGSQPMRNIDHTHSGYATSTPQTWYDNLTVSGNTSLNPFFYGTYLGVTKPNEPVTRNSDQVFQADAVGAMKQVVSEHFKTPHTFRVEWQPGRGGRLDWFTKSYRKIDENGTVIHMEGDGKGQDWEHSLSIPDYALDAAMGSKIPEEPSYIIINTAISSTWAFPYSVPDWCPKCYDCNDPKCQCSFNPGFCNMIKTGKVAMKIDSVRVYQSKDNNAHSGKPHTVGCDPVEFPTREFIKGYEYRYMRNPPFVYDDKHPLKDIKNGGGRCTDDSDCGGGVELNDFERGRQQSDEEAVDVINLDYPANGGGSSIREDQSPMAYTSNSDIGKIQPKMSTRRNERVGVSRKLAHDKSGYLNSPNTSSEVPDDLQVESISSNVAQTPKGICIPSTNGLFGSSSSSSDTKQCKCFGGYVGPHCLSVAKGDDAPGAYDLKKATVLFKEWSQPYLTKLQLYLVGFSCAVFLVFLLVEITRKKRLIISANTNELIPLQRKQWVT